MYSLQLYIFIILHFLQDCDEVFQFYESEYEKFMEKVDKVCLSLKIFFLTKLLSSRFLNIYKRMFLCLDEYLHSKEAKTIFFISMIVG